MDTAQPEYLEVVGTCDAIYSRALNLPALVQLAKRDPEGAIEIAIEIEVAYAAVELVPTRRAIGRVA